MTRETQVVEKLQKELMETQRKIEHKKADIYEARRDIRDLDDKVKRIKNQLNDITTTVKFNIVNEICREVAAFVQEHDASKYGYKFQIYGSIDPYNNFATLVKFRVHNIYPDTQPLIDKLEPLVTLLKEPIVFETQHDKDGIYMNYVVFNDTKYLLFDFMTN